MKKNTAILIAICLFSSIACSAQKHNYKFEVIEVHDGPVLKKGDPGTEDNKYGFEGGTVFKYKGEYQLFTAERFDDPILVKMRLAHWKSKDGLTWHRVSTLFESSGEFTGKDKAASFWSPMPFFNPEENRYNLLYVHYRAKPKDLTGWYLNYEGRIMRAVSQKKGKGGFGGPYKNVGYILEPDENDGPWVGLQGNDSFFAYQVGDTWYGFYGSAQTQTVKHPTMPIDTNYPKWTLTLAKADKLSGPWKKLTEQGPVEFHERFAENPVITKLKNGLYVAMVDGGGKHFGYSISEDGMNWSEAEFIKLQNYTKKWWVNMRTPLGLIPEKDGTYTVFFTAKLEKHDPNKSETGFAEVGKVKLKLIKNKLNDR